MNTSNMYVPNTGKWMQYYKNVTSGMTLLEDSNRGVGVYLEIPTNS